MQQAIAIQSGADRLTFWEGHLGYRHSLLVVFTALGLGTFFHFQVGYRVSVYPPAYLGGGFGIALLLLLVGRRYREDRVVHWLAGIPMAICTTVVVLLLSLVGGVVTKETLRQAIGVETVFGSWPFLFSVALMQLNLVLSAARRCWPMTRANVQFLLSHGGLALALYGGGYSAVSMERANLVCFLGRPTSTAYRADETELHVPFQATLREFELERFDPTLSVATLDTRAEGGMRLAHGSKFLKSGQMEWIGEHRVTVEKFYPRAALVGDRWRESPLPTAAPAALVAVTTPSGTKRGWVSCGGIDTPGSLLQITGDVALVMPEPRPKKFRSTLDLDRGGQVQRVEIEVNKPFSVGGTSLYQVSYDEKMGTASEYSVIEVVQDHGLPLVYAGMIALLGGVMMMMWTGATHPVRRSELR